MIVHLTQFALLVRTKLNWELSCSQRKWTIRTSFSEVACFPRASPAASLSWKACQYFSGQDHSRSVGRRALKSTLHTWLPSRFHQKKCASWYPPRFENPVSPSAKHKMRWISVLKTIACNYLRFSWVDTWANYSPSLRTRVASEYPDQWSSAASQTCSYYAV